jgi:SAM-dependent methyltransferase
MTRYWENWDNDTAAKEIDDYWTGSESEKSLRRIVSGKILDAVTEFPVLEIGCGSGLICEELIAQGMDPSSYVGADITDNMLKIAGERLPQVEFRKLDILGLDLLYSEFPSVVCIHVLQHLPGFEEALDELVRVAGKKLYVACWFAEAGDVKIEREFGQSFHNNRYRRADWEDRLLSNPKVASIRWEDFESPNAAVEVTMK